MTQSVVVPAGTPPSFSLRDAGVAPRGDAGAAGRAGGK
jgi:hypothetical protein